MRTYQVTSMDGHTMTVQLDDEAAGRLGLIPVGAQPDAEEHSTAPVATVEKSVTGKKQRRN